jgi:phosphoribosyl 1,2-cyclic phosphodiesterase
LHLSALILNDSFDPGRLQLRVTVLGSGSSGNSTLLESGGSGILVDAGFSCREIEQRLRIIGFSPDKIKAILVTHEHVDHIKGVEVFSKKHRVPVYLSEGTRASGLLDEFKTWLEPFETGSDFSVNGFDIHPFTIAHDAADPCGFVVKASGCTVGIGTDLGYVTRLIEEKFTGLDLLVFESNHDPEMLINGPYPWFLKQRISSRNGHLSNPEAADFLKSTITEQTRHILLAHLSRTNNTPSLAMTICSEALAEAGNSVTRLYMTNQFQCSETIDLEVG